MQQKESSNMVVSMILTVKKLTGRRKNMGSWVIKHGTGMSDDRMDKNKHKI